MIHPIITNTPNYPFLDNIDEFENNINSLILFTKNNFINPYDVVFLYYLKDTLETFLNRRANIHCDIQNPNVHIWREKPTLFIEIEYYQGWDNKRFFTSEIHFTIDEIINHYTSEIHRKIEEIKEKY